MIMFTLFVSIGVSSHHAERLMLFCVDVFLFVVYLCNILTIAHFLVMMPAYRHSRLYAVYFVTYLAVGKISLLSREIF